MSRLTFLIIWVIFAGALLSFMLMAWRARKRRDAGLAQPELDLGGDILATFERASYVSTTPVGQPLERVAIPGLSFKGWADITVRRDGVEIAVTGERPVTIAASQVHGTEFAGGRIGKVVERDGLALLTWQSSGATPRELESSFRFGTPVDQRRFADAVAQIGSHSSQTTHTSQEDA